MLFELLPSVSAAFILSLLALIICCSINIILFIAKRFQIKKSNYKVPLLKSFCYIFLISFLIIFPLKYYFGPFRIAHDLMSPNLLKNDIITIKRPNKNDVFKAGDLILFIYDDSLTTYTTRIIGVAGDVINFHNGKIWLNGNLLEQPTGQQMNIDNATFDVYYESVNNKQYNILKSTIEKNNSHSQKITVPDGKFFCLLDARYFYNSVFPTPYLIDEKQIFGYIRNILCSWDSKNNQFRRDRFFKVPD